MVIAVSDGSDVFTLPLGHTNAHTQLPEKEYSPRLLLFYQTAKIKNTVMNLKNNNG